MSELTISVRGILGVVPVLGICLGSGRVAVAINEAQKDKTRSIFESLDANNGYEEIFHGVCEIIPILGPITYGIVQLARIIYNCLFPTLEVSNKEDSNIEPLNTENIKIHVKSAEELRSFIGKTITMRVTRYAHESFNKNDDYRNLAGYTQTALITGKLLSITEQPVTKNQRYALEFSGEADVYKNVFNKANNEVVTYYMSNEEIEELSYIRSPKLD